MKNYSTYSKVLTLLSLLSLLLVGCSQNQVDQQTIPEVKLAPWARMDSTTGLLERDGQSVHADQQHLIFSTRNSIYTFPTDGSAMQSFRFDKQARTRPVYYRGVAYLIQSETQIKCIPYATNEATFYISLRDLGAINSTRTQFSVNTGTFDALAVNGKGQLLVLANDKMFPESLYQIQLDNRGRPVWESGRRSYQVALPESMQLSVIRPYSIDDRFYVHSDYKLLSINDKSVASDLTTNKDWSVNYMFLSGDALYAVIYSTSESSLFLYQSTDKGLRWQRQATVKDVKSRWTQFYLIKDRLIATVDGRLDEFDLKTYSFRSLSVEGLGGRAITGLAEQNGKVYVSVEDIGFFSKDLADFWR